MDNWSVMLHTNVFIALQTNIPQATQIPGNGVFILLSTKNYKSLLRNIKLNVSQLVQIENSRPNFKKKLLKKSGGLLCVF